MGVISADLPERSEAMTVICMTLFEALSIILMIILIIVTYKSLHTKKK